MIKIITEEQLLGEENGHTSGGQSVSKIRNKQ